VDLKLSNELKQELNEYQSIIRYLLNELPPDESRLLEERYFVDARLFARIHAIEEELIEDYINGDLSEAQRVNFEQHCLCTAERRDRVKFARTLMKAVAQQPASAVQPTGMWSKLVARWPTLPVVMRQPIWLRL
jgi:anti-sigma factor ChrR (cupin superfamily)